MTQRVISGSPFRLTLMAQSAQKGFVDGQFDHNRFRKRHLPRLAVGLVASRFLQCVKPKVFGERRKGALLERVGRQAGAQVGLPADCRCNPHKFLRVAQSFAQVHLQVCSYTAPAVHINPLRQKTCPSEG